MVYDHRILDGSTLRQRLRAEQVTPLREVLGMAEQIANALATAHATNIIHRDIKPDNVMIRRDGIVKVLDFGLAKLTENQNEADATWRKSITDSGTIMGTVTYMSPEQARGQRVDVRSDVFSLGVVLYEMIAGRTPFDGASVSDVIAAILRNDPLAARPLCARCTRRTRSLGDEGVSQRPRIALSNCQRFGAGFETSGAGIGIQRPPRALWQRAPTRMSRQL